MSLVPKSISPMPDPDSPNFKAWVERIVRDHDPNLTSGSDPGHTHTFGTAANLHATVHESGGADEINHDSLTGFVGNEHLDHSGISITAAGILSGGGILTSSQTITLNHSDIDHNQTSNYEANRHIDWTGATDNFVTSGNVNAGVITGTSLITGGNIGVIKTEYTDSDLIQLSLDNVAIQGNLSARDITGRSLTLDLSQDYEFSEVAIDSALSIQSQTLDTGCIIDLFNKRGDGGDATSLYLYSKGLPLDKAESEYLSIVHNSPISATIKSGATGVASTVLPMYLITGSNTTQLVLNTDNSISMSGDLSVTGTVTGGGLTVTNSVSATVLVEDNGDDTGGGFLGLRTSRGGGASDDNDYCGFFSFQFDDSGNNLTTGADIYTQVIDNTHPEEDADMIFREMVAGTLTEIMRFNGGNVGIKGTPSYVLDVTGTFRATGNSLIGGTLGVTGAVTGPAGSAFGGNKVPKRLYVSCEPLLGTGTVSEHGITIANGEYCRFNFYVDDYIDDSQNIVITFLLMSDEADATEDMLIYVQTRKTDNSEASAWNIENGTGFTFDSTNANQLSKYQYTLAAANYEADDGILLAISNNTGTASIKVYGCVFEMVAKDS